MFRVSLSLTLVTLASLSLLLAFFSSINNDTLAADALGQCANEKGKRSDPTITPRNGEVPNQICVGSATCGTPLACTQDSRFCPGTNTQGLWVDRRIVHIGQCTQPDFGYVGDCYECDNGRYLICWVEYYYLNKIMNSCEERCSRPSMVDTTVNTNHCVP